MLGLFASLSLHHHHHHHRHVHTPPFPGSVGSDDTQNSTWKARVKTAANTTLHHAKKHTGVGIVCAVAYFDPCGQLGCDLQAGSEYGHCRLLLYDRPKHKLLFRWLGLYPLYILSEIAIISTDLAELLGSAIALCMLFPQLELWHGVLLTAFDVIFILALGDPLRGRPVKMFEFLIASLVLAVLVCMIIIISKVDINWADAFEGYVPSKYIFASGGLYTSVGILGATVMPHSLFIGSALATQDRLSLTPAPEKDPKVLPGSRNSSESHITPPTSRVFGLLTAAVEWVRSAFRVPPPSAHSSPVTHHVDHENKPLTFVRAHIYHGIVDIVASLLGFAVVINSLILILASAVFFYGGGVERGAPASLFDAYDLIRDLVGKCRLPCSSFDVMLTISSIIATVAGQAVSEGFLRWRVSPVVRRLLTRLLAVIPSMVVAISVGQRGVDTLLVASQVVLSIVLPFITFPLIYLTSSKASCAGTGDVEARDDEYEDFSSGRVAVCVGAVIWVVVVAANMYVIVTLAMGK
ncbi:natural resistance-associated macrophage protein-domain-containing protein [Infundibulicybe gibba]|nr:natural resistance-associated macrophage protein-domain-containing protein [Infundibulicybe gibba]